MASRNKWSYSAVESRNARPNALRIARGEPQALQLSLDEGRSLEAPEDVVTLTADVIVEAPRARTVTLAALAGITAGATQGS